LYENNEGIEQNLEKALYWYQKAADNEHFQAQNNLHYYIIVMKK